MRSRALRQAVKLGNPEVMPEHLLGALLDQEGGVAAALLQKAGVDVAGLRQSVMVLVDGLHGLLAGGSPGCLGDCSRSLGVRKTRPSSFATSTSRRSTLYWQWFG